MTKIVSKIESRRTTIERLDILDCMKEKNRIYNKDVSQLCPIYANFIKDRFRIDADENRFVILLPNALDISVAIEDILVNAGHPMSLEEIMKEFNTIYPFNAIYDATKFKSYIFRNTNITPKGKTGIYILKSWTNHFTGTLTSYIEHILRIFNEPISLDYLVDFALEEFPKSNRRSIQTLISGDKDGRFIIYDDDYIGLADNPISGNEIRERRVVIRLDFATRFEELKDFVKSLKRLPNQAGSEEEKSLARWINNVMKSNVESSDEQMFAVNNFLSEHKLLPQNVIEYNFKQMCDEIKVMVVKSFALPKASENAKQYRWLRKNLEKYITYEDNRKTYFEELLVYLRNFGFYL